MEQGVEYRNQDQLIREVHCDDAHLPLPSILEETCKVVLEGMAEGLWECDGWIQQMVGA